MALCSTLAYVIVANVGRFTERASTAGFRSVASWDTDRHPQSLGSAAAWVSKREEDCQGHPKSPHIPRHLGAWKKAFECGKQGHRKACGLAADNAPIRAGSWPRRAYAPWNMMSRSMWGKNNPGGRAAERRLQCSTPVPQ